MWKLTLHFLNVWQYAVTGGTGNYWSLVENIQAPGSAFSKIVQDQVLGASASWSNASNDPAIAGKFLFGSPDALYGSYVIDPTNPINSSTPKLRTELSYIVPFGNSLVTYASDKNQLRLLDYTRNDLTRLQNGGGVVHSVETIASNQTYRIINGDINGVNHFTLSLNNGASASPTLLYGDLSNKLGIGVSEFTPLVANTTINGSLAVGRLTTSFYLASTGATFTGGIGAIIEGNVAIGRNNNGNANLGIYSPTGAFGSVVKIDTNQSAASASAVSDLFFGGGMYSNFLSPSSPVNYWRFRHDSYSSPGNIDYRKFTLFGAQQGLTGSTGIASRSVFAIGLTAIGTTVSTQFSIDNTDLYDKFEIGDSLSNRISLGNQQGDIASGFMNMHIGFNLSRSPITNSWRRMSDGSNNAGRTFWSSPYTGLGLSIFSSTGATNVTGITDAQVYDNTRFYINPVGKLSISETRNASIISNLGLSVDFGATGTTGESTNANTWRRFVAAFGNGPHVSSLGTPLIATTNGVTQSISTGISLGVGFTASTLPHYTWSGSDKYGLYLSQGTTANSLAGLSVGLAVDGTAVVTASGAYNTEKRVGILQENPLERLHIGSKLMYSDGVSKFIGYNVYSDTASGTLRRAYGSTASGATQEGGFSMRFLENNRVDGTLGLLRYANLGTKLSLIPQNIGGTASALPADGSGLVHRSITISPPPVGPTTSGWNNFTPFVPQVAIGLNTADFASEQDSATSLKRGTLSLAAQLRFKPATAAVPPTGPFGITIEDQYNLGLYSYDGYPVSAIYSTGGNPSSTTKSFGINFLTEGGNAIAGDIPFLAATSDKNLSLPYQRIANFGAGFRLGVNIVPPNQPGTYSSSTDPIFNFASLLVGGYTEGLPPDFEQAIIAKGIVTIDQSVYSPGSGGNQGLIIKDNTILAHGATSRLSTSNYLGDWGMQYTKFSSTEAGLNFWKPFIGAIGSATGQNGILYLSDNGKVSVGFPSPASGDWTITTSQNTVLGLNQILEKGYQRTITPTGGGGFAWSGTGLTGTFTAKFAVNGYTKQTGIFNTSDERLKKEIARPEEGSMLSKVLKLKPVLYTWNEKYNSDLKGKVELGFFAQEVEEILPEVVHQSKSSNFDDERVLEYNAIFTAAVGAIQDQQKIIDLQAQTIKNLENKLSKIEELLSKNNIQ